MNTKTIEQYLSELKSSSHTPGGGAVAALNGAQSAALLCMVSSIMLKKDPANDQLINCINVSKKLVDKFELEIANDIKYFQAIMDAYRMPKSTQLDVEIRSRRIHESICDSLYGSIYILNMYVELLKAIEIMSKICQQNLISDIKAAAMNAYAGASITQFNSDANIVPIQHNDNVGTFKTTIHHLMNEITTIYKTIIID